MKFYRVLVVVALCLLGAAHTNAKANAETDDATIKRPPPPERVMPTEGYSTQLNQGNVTSPFVFIRNAPTQLAYQVLYVYLGSEQTALPKHVTLRIFGGHEQQQWSDVKTISLTYNQMDNAAQGDTETGTQGTMQAGARTETQDQGKTKQVKKHYSVKVKSSRPDQPAALWAETVDAEIPIKDFLAIADAGSFSFQIANTRDTVSEGYFRPLEIIAMAARGEM